MKKIKKLLAKLARIGEMREALQALKFWEMVAVIITVIVLGVLAWIMTGKVIDQQTIQLPRSGGKITEGVVGEPNIFNPLLSVRDEDQEVVALVFAGLLRKENGTYTNDLAEEVSKSKDQKTITVKIKPDLEFHNGDKLNADDVVFTITMIKDPRTKSPLKVLWDSVNVTKKDDLTVIFSLKQPYAFFDDMLTVGIISEDVFKNTTKEEFPALKEHQKPIGAGPYKFTSSSLRNEKIVKVRLKRFRKYEPKALIKKITINYYSDEDDLIRAFRQNKINLASGISPEAVYKNQDNTVSTDLDRAFALFINRQNVNYSQKTIEALNLLIPRELIIKEALFGMGNELYGPYPKNEVPGNLTNKERVEKAFGLLEADGWKHLTDGTYAKSDKAGTKILSIKITSPDTRELREVGDKIVTAFREAGIETSITYVKSDEFSDKIIRTREFDFVLFGQILHNPSDLYAFWHSSQKNDPGLNIGSYTNKSVDQKLEALLKETDQDKQSSLIKDVSQSIKSDTGALFIFSPKYIILSDQKIKPELPNTMSYSRDRYQNISKWFVKTKRVLNIFNNNNSK